MNRRYRYKEAYCLLKYEDLVTEEVEIIWNSRDGPAPRSIVSLAGNEARRIIRVREPRARDFTPAPGMRIIVDASTQHAHIQQEARAFIKQNWKYGLKTAWGTRRKALERLLAEWTKPGNPTIIEAP